MNDSELIKAIARLETKVDMLLEERGKSDERVETLTNRVSALEGWRTFLAGVWAVVTAAGAVVIKVVL